MHLLQWTAALSLFLAGSHAATTPPGVVVFPIEKRDNVALKRRGTTNSPLSSKGSQYFIQFSLGTPAQSFKAHLDTGSSDLVVLTKNSAYCTKDADNTQHCSDVGTYTESSSSTNKIVSNDFTVTYGDGETGTGNFDTDTLLVNGINIDTFGFGVALGVSTISDSIFGIAYPSNTAAKTPYDNLGARLVKAGVIGSRVYSLYLSPFQDTAGSLLFGGIDSEKYCGSLAKLPIQKSAGEDQYREFLVNVAGMSVQDPSLTTPIADAPAGLGLLDSGTSINFAPQAFVDAVFSEYKVSKPVNKGDYPLIDCSMAKSSAKIVWNFAGVAIPIGLDKLIGTGPDANGKCLFLLDVARDPNGSPYMLGAPFLAAVYTVFDLDNNNAFLAPANTGATRSNIMAVGSGPDAVPVIAGQACGGVAPGTTTTSASSTTTADVTTTLTSTTTVDVSTTTTTDAASVTTTASSHIQPQPGSTSSSTTSAAGSFTTSVSSDISPQLGSTTSTTTTASFNIQPQLGSTTSTPTSATESVTTSVSSNISPQPGSTTGTATTTTSWILSTVSTTSISTTGSSSWVSISTIQTGSRTWSDRVLTTSTTLVKTTSSKTTNSLTPAWDDWADPSHTLTYSTLTSTIRGCPAGVPQCAPQSKTAITTITTVVPFCTEVIYSTRTLTYTIACAGAGCSPVSTRTFVTSIPIRTTIVPYIATRTQAVPHGQITTVSPPPVTVTWGGTTTVVTPPSITVACGDEPITISPNVITITSGGKSTIISPAPITVPAVPKPTGGFSGNGNGDDDDDDDGWGNAATTTTALGMKPTSWAPAASSGAGNGGGNNGDVSPTTYNGDMPPATYKGAAMTLNIGLTTSILGAVFVLIAI